jgi:hypothetical protein
MMFQTADEYSYRIVREGRMLRVIADDAALEVFDDTLELCGVSTNNSEVRRSPGERLVFEGTVAMWLQFEVLNTK